MILNYANALCFDYKDNLHGGHLLISCGNMHFAREGDDCLVFNFTLPDAHIDLREDQRMTIAMSSTSASTSVNATTSHSATSLSVGFFSTSSATSTTPRSFPTSSATCSTFRLTSTLTANNCNLRPTQGPSALAVRAGLGVSLGIAIWWLSPCFQLRNEGVKD